MMVYCLYKLMDSPYLVIVKFLIFLFHYCPMMMLLVDEVVLNINAKVIKWFRICTNLPLLMTKLMIIALFKAEFTSSVAIGHMRHISV